MKYGYGSIAAVTALVALAGVARGQEMMNPYEGVEWGEIEFLHSFSHQHGSAPQTFWDMGFRHLPFSNYYPSRPFALPESFLREHPEAIGTPNAEHHTVTDSGPHFNTLGSHYTTGSGHHAQCDWSVAPIEYVFPGLHVYDPNDSPWVAVYRLELSIGSRAGADKKAAVSLTIDGAREISHSTFAPIGDGIVRDRRYTGSAMYVRAESEKVQVRLDFNPASTRITQFRLMQGVNRPWRDAFRAALDGTRLDTAGRPIEGLLFPDGGGITINHPSDQAAAPYMKMLDFDSRVLGIEVWNQHQWFGRFGPEGDGPNMRYYRHWDDILGTGRRCFGFFVKDHYLFGRGRNVLLVPQSGMLTRQQRKHNALQAYRQGRFFGLLGALAVDEAGTVVSPYDYSQFRFTRIEVKQSADKHPLGVAVSVGGADGARRPNVQIRFITEAGVAHLANGPQTLFEFRRDAAGAVLVPVYVRIEAFAYPNTHLNGRPLTSDAFSAMNVHEISHLHDRLRDISAADGAGPPGQAPIPIVDMIFSQPILFRLRQ